MDVQFLPSSVEINSRKIQHDGSKENNDTEKFASLVLRPLLSRLQLAGYPVPPHCTHNTRSTVSSGWEEISNCSDINGSVEADKPMFQNGGFGPVNNFAEEQLSDSPAESRDRNAKSVTNAVLVQSLQPSEAKEKKELLETGQTNRILSRVDKGKRKDDTEKAEKREIRKKKAYERETMQTKKNRKEDKKETRKALCRKCTIKAAGGKAIFVFILILFVTNVARYVTIFFNVTAFNGSVVSSVMTMDFFVFALYMYVTSYHSLARHLPRQLALLQFYQATYSFTVDINKVSKRLKVSIWLNFVLLIVMVSTFTIGIHTFMPSFRRHLSPFDNLKGIDLYVASAVFAVVVIAGLGILNVLTIFLHIAAFILKKEFREVAARFGSLFESHDGPVLGNVPQAYLQEGEEENSEELRLGLTKMADRKNHIPKCLTKFNPLNLNISHQQIHVVKEFSVGGDRPMPQRFPESKATSLLENVDLSDVQTDSHRLWQTEQESKDLCHVMYTQHLSNQTEHQCLEDSATDRQNAFDRLNHSKEFGEEHFPSTEDGFDYLRAQHQVLCAILSHCQGCLTHLMSMAYINGIPMFCLLIFGLTSSSLSYDDALFMLFFVVQIALSICNVTVMGILINDAAHAPLDVIYAADWSWFSDRLLHKVQLFASRLGNSKIGFDVYGLFVIDRSTVLMVVGTLATYTVVVLDFQQSAGSVGDRGNNSTAF